MLFRSFESTPQIFHALLFETDYYLRDSIEAKLSLRKELKYLIKNETNRDKKLAYEIKSELIKLLLNSCYGFTLCNLTSSKFKCFENRKKIPIKKTHITSCLQIQPHCYLIEINKQEQQNADSPFQTMLGHVGCSILFYSKIILLKRLYFILKFFNPTHVQLVYMDTDSAHLLVKYKNYVENVDKHLQAQFLAEFPKHFECGNKLSGIWVEENFFENAEYIGEKSYRLFNNDETQFLTHMKGLNQYFQQFYASNAIDIKNTPIIAYNQFAKSSDFSIYKCYMHKDLFSNYIPIKRYFISPTGSLPLKL